MENNRTYFGSCDFFGSFDHEKWQTFQTAELRDFHESLLPDELQDINPTDYVEVAGLRAHTNQGDALRVFTDMNPDMPAGEVVLHYDLRRGKWQHLPVVERRGYRFGTSALEHPAALELFFSEKGGRSDCQRARLEYSAREVSGRVAMQPESPLHSLHSAEVYQGVDCRLQRIIGQKAIRRAF